MCADSLLYDTHMMCWAGESLAMHKPVAVPMDEPIPAAGPPEEDEDDEDGPHENSFEF